MPLKLVTHGIKL
jgi:hypothetical protein